MVFTKRLRDAVRRGDITCSVRIWMHPHVKVGGRYPMEEGEIEIDSIRQIDYHDITAELARESGFPDVPELLAVAKHGKGRNVYVVRFHYIPPRKKRAPSATATVPARAADGTRAGTDSGTPRRPHSENR